MKRTWCLNCGPLTLAVNLKYCPYCGLLLGRRPYRKNAKQAYKKGYSFGYHVAKEGKE